MRIISSKEESSINERISLLTEEDTAANNGLDVFQEMNTALGLAMEDRDWQKLSDQNNKEFSIEGLKRINELARLYWLKNPIIRRAVLTQTQYVFAQVVNIQSDNEEVDEVIQAFFDDPKNKAELTGHQNQSIKETE